MSIFEAADFGIHIDPLDSAAKVLDDVRAAEELGFGSVWLADSPVIFREAYVLMAAAATMTSRIAIGSGVTNPLTRDPSVIASAFSVLDELAPGRIELGIGSGDSALRTIGRRPATMDRFEEITAELSALLGADRVEPAKPDYDLRFPRRVPVLISATGPRGLRMAARAGDGVILHFLTDPVTIEHAKQTVLEEGRRIGRDMSDFRFVGWIPCNVDPDPERARAEVRVHVARHLITSTAAVPGVDPALIETLRESYVYREHMHPQARHAELVPLDIVDRFALVGRPAEVAGQLRHLLTAGLDHLVVVPRGDSAGIMRRFATEAVPLYREAEAAGAL